VGVRSSTDQEKEIGEQKYDPSIGEPNKAQQPNELKEGSKEGPEAEKAETKAEQPKAEQPKAEQPKGDPEEEPKDSELDSKKSKEESQDEVPAKTRTPRRSNRRLSEPSPSENVELEIKRILDANNIDTKCFFLLDFWNSDEFNNCRSQIKVAPYLVLFGPNSFFNSYFFFTAMRFKDQVFICGRKIILKSSGVREPLVVAMKKQEDVKIWRRFSVSYYLFVKID